MATRRILLLMDNRGDSNWGSQATTTMLVRLLNERFPEAEIRGVPRSGCRPKGLARSFATRLAPTLVTISPSEWALRKLTHSWADDFEWADLVVVNGEGTLHPQPQAVRWISSIVALARRHKKQYWIVNCSIQCEGDSTQALFEVFFREAAHVAVREVVSYRELQRMSVPCELAADCAFLAKSENNDSILDRVGVSGPYAVMTGSASVKKWPLEHQRQVIAALKERGLGVLYTHSDEKDVENLRQLGGDIPVVTHADASYAELISIQEKAEILVGGRFHPTIFAATHGTPLVAFQSNTHKMSGLMEMLGCKELLFQFSMLDGSIKKINDVLDDRQSWSQRLAAAAAPLVAQARKNVLGLD